MKKAVESEETQLLGKACKCFSNFAQVNDLNGVASKQNWNFRPKGEDRSGRRPLPLKRNLTF